MADGNVKGKSPGLSLKHCRHLKNKDFKQASSFFKQALIFDSKKSDTYFHMGVDPLEHLPTQGRCQDRQEIDARMGLACLASSSGAPAQHSIFRFQSPRWRVSWDGASQYQLRLPCCLCHCFLLPRTLLGCLGRFAIKHRRFSSSGTSLPHSF